MQVTLNLSKRHFFNHRNSIYGEQPKDEKTLMKLVDKVIRLKLLPVKRRGMRYIEEGLRVWFGTRIP